MEIKVLDMIFMQDDIPTWCSVIEIPVGNVVVVLLNGWQRRELSVNHTVFGFGMNELIH